MKKLIGILAIITASILISFCLVGIATEKVLKANLALFNQNNLNHLELMAYHRGWFESDARLKWIVKASDFANLSPSHASLLADNLKVAEIPIVIHHGPIIWFRHEFKFGLGLSSAALDIPSLFAQEGIDLPQGMGKEALIHLDIFVNYLANSLVDLEVPRFSYHNATTQQEFRCLGIQAHSLLAGNDAALKGTLNIKGLSWRKGPFKAGITALSSEYNLHKNSANLYWGQALLKLNSALVMQGGQTIFRIHGAEFKSDSLYDNQGFNSMLSGRFAQSSYHQMILGPSHGQLRFEHLDKNTLEEMNQKLRAYQSTGDESKGGTLLIISSGLPNLLSKGAQIQLNQVDLAFPEGLLQLNLNVNFPNQLIYNPLEMLKMLQADASLRLPEALFKKTLLAMIHRHQDLRQNRALQPLNNEAIHGVQIDEKIKHWVDSGLMVKTGDKLDINLKLNQGKLLINQHPLTTALLLN